MKINVIEHSDRDQFQSIHFFSTSFYFRCHEYQEFAVYPFLCFSHNLFLLLPDIIIDRVFWREGFVRGIIFAYSVIWIKWNTSLFEILLCFISLFAHCDFIYLLRVSHLIVVWPRYWLSVEENPHHTQLVLWGWVRLNPNSKIVSNNVIYWATNCRTTGDTLQISSPRCWRGLRWIVVWLE
jgi:hypothetical protein